MGGELRSARKALAESQERREELEEVARLLERTAGQRDAYFEELVRLRAENVALRAEVERLSERKR